MNQRRKEKEINENRSGKKKGNRRVGKKQQKLKKRTSVK